MNYKEAVETYVNGNKSDFKTWLKKCKKIDMLNAINYSLNYYNSRHVLIYTMILMLEDSHE